MVIRDSMSLFEPQLHDLHAQNLPLLSHNSVHHLEPCNAILNILHVINRWLFDFYRRNVNFQDPICGLKTAMENYLK